MVLSHLRAGHEAARRMEQAALCEVMKAEAEVASLESLASTVYPVTAYAETPSWSASNNLVPVPTTNVEFTAPAVNSTAMSASTALSAHTAMSASTALSDHTASSGATAQPGNKVNETTQTAPNQPEQGSSVSDDSSSVDPQSSSSSETSSDESKDETVWPAEDVRLVAIL